MSFTAIAYAIHLPDQPAGESIVVSKDSEITLGGRLLMRGWYFSDISSLSLPEDTGSEATYSTNAYLYVDAKITDNLKAFMELETSGGGSTQSGLYFWGSTDSKPNADLFFRQAWIQYTGSGLLGVPSGLKVGHQLLTLGEKQFYNMERFGTDAIVLFVQPMPELHLYALTAKQWEGNTADSGDDIDAYVIGGNYKLDKDNTLGLFVVYAETDDLKSTPLESPNVDTLGLWDAGLHANGKLFGALTYAAELDWQFGDGDLVTGESIDAKGWGIMAKLGYAIPDTPLTIRASGAMGSGEDSKTDDEWGEFQYIGPQDGQSKYARFVHYTQIYERSVATASFNQLIAGQADPNAISVTTNRNTGIANTTYLNLGADFMPMKDLSLSLDGFWLMATETGAWEEEWEAVDGRDVDDGIGWEIDFKGSYKITKNLTYFVEAAYFDAGDFYKDAYNISDPEAVTQIVHGLNLTF
jgi:hypothetical protein